MNDDKYFCERIYFDKDFFQDGKDKVDMFFFNISYPHWWKQKEKKKRHAEEGGHSHM